MAGRRPARLTVHRYSAESRRSPQIAPCTTSYGAVCPGIVWPITERFPMRDGELSTSSADRGSTKDELTLRQFLMRRLDEDEAEALTEIHRRATKAARPTTVWAPSRILAECEIKRRLILGEGDCDESDMFRLLATPYADHADYLQSWATR